MQRRDFIKVVAGLAITSPFIARAQQGKLRLVGVVSGFSEEEFQPLMTAFLSRLSELGWIEGRNFMIDARLGAGNYTKMTDEAGALVSRNPEVIVAMGTPGLTAVRQHTRVVPVVFTLVSDPVRAGFVESLARPGGHATGFTNFEFSIGGKWLELLQQVNPSLTHVTIIANLGNPATTKIAQSAEQAGKSLAITATTAEVKSLGEIEMAITTAAQEPNGGLIVLPDSLAVVNSDRIVALAQLHRLPCVYPFRTFAEKGGLLTYGLDVAEIYRQAADYTDRILKGEKPADLPVQAPTKFELIINLKTAKALALSIPPSSLASADEVIE